VAGRLNKIALDAFGEEEIARICGLDWLDCNIRENASTVFIYIDREDWPPGASDAWDAQEAAMRAFTAYGNEPDVPAHLRWSV
jgi:hypothetical protein